MAENRFAHETEGTICRLELFRDNLEIIFGIGKKDRAEFYRVSSSVWIFVSVWML